MKRWKRALFIPALVLTLLLSACGGGGDGGLTWRFRLREDVTWVDADGAYKADCTAQDWITAMEWILNFHKTAGTMFPCPA